MGTTKRITEIPIESHERVCVASLFPANLVPQSELQSDMLCSNALYLYGIHQTQSLELVGSSLVLCMTHYVPDITSHDFVVNVITCRNWSAGEHSL